MLTLSAATVGATVTDLTPDRAKPGATIDVLSWDIVGPSGNTTLTAVDIGFNGTDSDDIEYAMIYVNNTLFQTLYGPVGTMWSSYFIPEGQTVTVTLVFQIDDDAVHGHTVDGKINFYTLTYPGASGTDPQPINPAGGTIIDDVKPVVVSATAVPDPAKAGLVTVTVVFNETMKTSVSPSVNVTGLNTDPYSVAQSSYSGDTWVGTFTLLDQNEEKNATIAVGLGQDVAGNVMDTNSSAGTFKVDTIDPEVTDIWVSDVNITEADDGDFFYVYVNFSEPMNTTVAPNIEFIPGVSSTLSFNSDAWSLGDMRYTANYTIADNDVEVDGVDVNVSGAVDLAGNEDPTVYADLFDVDTRKPVVVSATAVPDPAKAGSVTVTVVFNETMKTGINPTVNVSGLASGPYAVTKTSYTGATWIGTFTLLDDNEETTATIEVSLGQDAMGNVMDADMYAGYFEVDTIDPSVTDIAVSDTLINEDLVLSPGTFQVIVTFNETMDTGVTPTISFAPVVSSTLTSPSGAWSSGNTTYTVTYTLVDVNVEVDGVNVSVTGGKDPAGNSHAMYKEDDMFDIDTKAPTVDDIWVSDTLINEADDGGYFLVNVTFSEAMNTTVIPDITFSPDVETSGTLTFSSDGWSLGDTIYTANYTIDDVDEEVDDVNVSVSGAKDLAGNDDPLTETAMFDVDTKKPIVVGFQVSDILIIEADIPGTFQVIVTFNETMDTGVTPDIDFDPDVETSGTLTFSSDAWSLGDTRYTANYTINDVDEEQDDVDVDVSGGKDLAGNMQVPFTASMVFDVDSVAPVIYSISWSVDGMPVTLPESNITVTLIGESGYTATFDIVGVGSSDLVTGASMVEDPTGVYNGTYTVMYGDDGTYLIDGYLEDSAGNIASIVGTTNHPCELFTWGDGTAEWSSDESHSGSYSVELYVEDGSVDWAEVSIPVDIAIEDINELSFWEKIDLLEESGWDVNIILGVDCDGDDVYESNTTDWHLGPGQHTAAALGNDSFVEMDGWGGMTGGTFTTPVTYGGLSADVDWTMVDVYDNVTWGWWTPKADGTGFAYFGMMTSGNFEDFQNWLDGTTDNSRIDIGDRVKVIKLVLGGAGSWNNETAYVDDLKLNSVIYNLELPFKIDTVPPSVLLVEVSDTLINEADDGDLFNVTVHYSEDMNTTIDPSITFDPSVNPTLTTPKSGAWVNSTTYKYTYTIDDVDEEVDDVDVNVSGAEDLAGKVQVNYTAPDMFDVDTIAPPAPTGLDAPEYINIANQTAYPVSGSAEAGTTVWVRLRDGSNAVDTSVYTASGSFTIVVDASSLDDGTITIDANATDWAGNTGPYSANITRTKDTVRPTVDSADADPDPAKNGTVTVTVDFSETMKTSVSPTVEVTGLATDPYTVSEDTYSGDTWNGTFTLFDDDEEETATISVEDGRDLADNVMLADATETFEVDTIDPTVSAIWVSDMLINEADDGGSFWVNATFSEAMNTSVIPDISFTPDVESSGTLDFENGWWSLGNTRYTANYTIDDVDEEEDDVNVTVSGAKDEVGNSQDPDPTKATGMFDVDTIAPEVDDIEVSDELINEADDGDLFYVYVNFSEPMNISVAPTISFDPDVTENGTLSFNSGAWDLGDTRYTANYTIADVDEEIPDVDVMVTDAEDKAGNEDPLTEYDMFDVDTIAPTVDDISVSDDWIKEDDIPGLFNVTVTFSEAMNTSVIPDIDFDPDVSSTLENETGAWSAGDTIYTFTYDIADADVVVEDVNVTVSGAEDAAGNPDPLTEEDLFDIDTLHHAGVPEYIDVWAEYSAPMSITLNANEVAWPMEGWYSEWNSPENALVSDNEYAFITYSDVPPYEKGLVLFFEDPPEAVGEYGISSVMLHVEQMLIPDFWDSWEDWWVFDIGSEDEQPISYDIELERQGTNAENELSIDITEAIDDSYDVDWEFLSEIAVAIYPDSDESPLAEWYVDNVWIEVNYVYDESGESITVPVSGEANVYANVTDWFNDTVPDDTLITFETDLGTIYPLTDNTTSGLAMTTIISTDVGTATVNATGSLDGHCEVTFVAHTLDVELSPGWNLISVPRKLENSSIEAVFEGITTITKIYTYQNGNWTGSAYAGSWSELITGHPIEDIEDGIGYWVYATGPTTVTISLEPLGYVEVIPPDYELSMGWTMVGYTTLQLEPEMPVPVYLTNLDGTWKSLYRYTPTVGYEQAKPDFGFEYTELLRGYWIYLNEVGVLVP